MIPKVDECKQDRSMTNALIRNDCNSDICPLCRHFRDIRSRNVHGLNLDFWTSSKVKHKFANKMSVHVDSYLMATSLVISPISHEIFTIAVRMPRP